MAPLMVLFSSSSRWLMSSFGLLLLACSSASAATAPSNTVAPVLTNVTTGLSAGTNPVTQGNTLSVSPGTWSSSGQPIVITYQWRRASDSSGSNLQTISNETTSTYTVHQADVDSYLTCLVTASLESDANTNQSVLPNPAYTTKVLNGNVPPINSALPTVSGTITQGQTLTVSNGTWSDEDGDTLTFTYQWHRADSSSTTPSGATAVTGKTTSSYALAQADVGKYLTCIVTASDGTKSISATAAWVGPIANINDPPNSSDVVFNSAGTLKQGDVLTIVLPNWTDPDQDSLTYEYSWLRSATNVGTGTTIVSFGSANRSYTLTQADVGNYIQCAIRASDGNLQTTNYSAFTSNTIADGEVAPVNSILPQVSGTVTQGQTVTVSTGTWNDDDGTIPTFTYQWHRAPNSSTTPSNSTEISTQTTNAYTLTQSDVGKYVTCVVTASDGTFNIPATALWKGPVADTNLPPIAATVTFTGTAIQGQTLTIDTPSWTDPDGDVPTYEFSWLRSSTNSGIGTTIKSFNASNTTYTLTQADVGFYIQCAIRASDPQGLQTTKYSDFTPNKILDANVAPANVTLPAISGTPTQGQTLTVSNGTWSDEDNDGTAIIGYQWHRTNNINTPIDNNTKISGETTTSYLLTQADVGKYVTCVVTCSDGTADTNATAARKGPIANINDAPIYSGSDLAISGTYQVGSTLTCANGTWTDADGNTLSYSYVWKRSSSVSGSNPVTINGATAQTYTLQVADLGSYISCTVSASDGIVTTPPSSSAAWVGPVTVSDPPTFTLKASQLATDRSKVQHGFIAWAQNITPHGNRTGDISFTCTLPSGDAGLFAVAPFITKTGELFFTPNNTGGSTTITVIMSVNAVNSAPQSFTLSLIGTQSPATDFGFDINFVTMDVEVTGGVVASVSGNGESATVDDTNSSLWLIPWLTMPANGTLRITATATAKDGGTGTASATVTSVIPTPSSPN